jgi:hypothetical protein
VFENSLCLKSACIQHIDEQVIVSFPSSTRSPFSDIQIQTRYLVSNIEQLYNISSEELVSPKTGGKVNQLYYIDNNNK